MRSHSLVLPAVALLLLAPVPATAATLTVGPGQMYASPCLAIAAAQPNDTVAIWPGTFTDTCSIAVAGLTVKGVNGQPKIDLSGGSPYGQKGIYVIDADGVTIENLELTGSQIPAASGENGAAIRIEATNLTVRGCYIHDNQDGILGYPPQLGGTLLIESTEFSHNGLGNGCDDMNAGCTHNVYIGPNFDKVTFQYNWSHHLATDTPDKGHLLKSRAQQTYVLYNRLTGEDDTDSYEIDIPQGGLAVVVGNMVEKPPMSGNGSLLSYAEEGLQNPDNRIFIVNNTFVNDKSGGTFLNITNGGVLVAHNNIFAGPGTPSSTGALSADNLSGGSPLFVNQAGFDYDLMAGSPAIGIGVAPGSADAFSLTPVEEYVHPLQHTARTDGGMTAGAFQYGAVMGTGGSGAGTSVATSSASSGCGAGGASGTGAAPGGTGTSTASTGSSGGGPGAKGGCSCSMPATNRVDLAWLATLAVPAYRRQRRRSHRTG